MKNGDLFDLQRGLRAVAGLRGVKFAYAVGKNLRRVSEEVRELLGARPKEADALAGYEVERQALCCKYSRKGDDGEPVTAGNEYVLEDGKRAEFCEGLEGLRAKYKEEIDEYKRLLEEYEELLGQEVAFELHRVAFDDLPDDITGGQIEAILEMVMGP